MMNTTPKTAVDRFCFFVTRHRAAALALTLIVAVLFAVGIPRIQGKVLLEEMLPYEHPFLQIIIDFSDEFGTGARPQTSKSIGSCIDRASSPFATRLEPSSG